MVNLCAMRHGKRKARRVVIGVKVKPETVGALDKLALLMGKTRSSCAAEMLDNGVKISLAMQSRGANKAMQSVLSDVIGDVLRSNPALVQRASLIE